jgi:hypothetical protein
VIDPRGHDLGCFDVEGQKLRLEKKKREKAPALQRRQKYIHFVYYHKLYRSQGELSSMKSRVPVPWNSNPQANERLRFYCVISERTDRLNGIAPNFAARADTR